VANYGIIQCGKLKLRSNRDDRIILADLLNLLPLNYREFQYSHSASIRHFEVKLLETSRILWRFSCDVRKSWSRNRLLERGKPSERRIDPLNS